MKQILIRPVITEKTMKQANELGKYTFLVNPDATKIEVSKLVAEKFSVKVLNVHMINILGKEVSFGKKRIKGHKSSYKKAIVQLKKGDKIKIFEIK